MAVGEVPITSYFTRVPQKKKSKTAKRKRHSVDDPEEDGQPVKKEPRIQPSLPFPRASTCRKPAPARVVSPPLVPRPHVCPAGSRIPPPSRISPPAPLRTAESDAVQSKSVAFATPPSVSAFHHAINPPSDPDNSVADIAHESDEDEIPAASIVPSSQSQYISSPNLATIPGHKRIRISTPGSHSDSFQLDDSIPSSQSQHVPTSPLSPRRWSGNSVIDLVPSSQSQYFAVTPTPVERDDDGFVVPSSQSQWLLPFPLDGEEDISPAVTGGAAFDESIPSSQSQFEVELAPMSDESSLNGRPAR
jgi:hypothetical protein